MKTIAIETKQVEISDELYRQILDSQKPKGRWKPEDGDEYYFVEVDGNVDGNVFFSTNQPDKWNLIVDNVFKTENEAKEHKKYLESMARIRNSTTFVPNWEDGDESKYCVVYHQDLKILTWDSTYFQTFVGTTYYATKEETEKAIGEYRDDYLRVFNVIK